MSRSFPRFGNSQPVFLSVLIIYFCCARSPCCPRAFSSCGEQGLLLAAVHRLLTAGASLGAEHRLWVHMFQQLGHAGLAALWHVASSWTGIEPMSPTLAGGFLTTTPPGKSSALNSFLLHFFCSDSSPYIVSLYGVHWLSIFLSFSFGASIWMLSTNLSSNTLILFSFSFPCSSLLLNLC